MANSVKRGDVCWYEFQSPDKRRPVLIMTRDSAIRVLNSVTVAPITSAIRNIPTEVLLTEADGLPKACAANLDNLQTVPKQKIGDRITALSEEKMQTAAQAACFALGIE